MYNISRDFFCRNMVINLPLVTYSIVFFKSSFIRVWFSITFFWSWTTCSRSRISLVWFWMVSFRSASRTMFSHISADVPGIVAHKTRYTHGISMYFLHIIVPYHIKSYLIFQIIFVVNAELKLVLISSKISALKARIAKPVYSIFPLASMLSMG